MTEPYGEGNTRTHSRRGRQTAQQSGGATVPKTREPDSIRGRRVLPAPFQPPRWMRGGQGGPALAS